MFFGMALVSCQAAPNDQLRVIHRADRMFRRNNEPFAVELPAAFQVECLARSNQRVTNRHLDFRGVLVLVFPAQSGLGQALARSAAAAVFKVAHGFTVSARLRPPFATTIAAASFVTWILVHFRAK